MKTKIYLIALGIGIRVMIYGQVPSPPASSANSSFWSAYADKIHLTPAEKKEFLAAHQLSSANLTTGTIVTSNQKPNPSTQNTFAGPCINIDYENGSLSGWTPSSGFHPIFNPLGCCPNPGGQQLVTSGAGLDPAGGFPLVAPGGNFSLRLGDSNTGGEADRIEQTFLVSASNANFTYRYAVVFQDPGHTVSEQPSFQVEMIDSTGAQVPCTFYNVAAGGNIPGFFSSQTQAGVVYKPWTNVLVDLTNYIGQNITIRFTTYDCALGGHYGYAYIDGSCQAFVTGSADSVCAGTAKNFCAPNGLGSYTWNGPGINNQTAQCINAVSAGVYTCQTTLLTGCTGPVFTYTLYNYPSPVASFTTSALNACSTQQSFINNSSIANGTIASYSWNFGNGTSTQANPTNNFPGSGTYSVNLVTTSNHGCQGDTLQYVIIYPPPVISFAAPASCMNAMVNFTNTSNVSSGSITSYTWTFGNGGTSQLVNPSVNYTAFGNFPVNLSGTSDKGCVGATVNNITIHPLPTVSFYGSNVCQGNGTNFYNTSSINNGTISSFTWDLDNNGTPDAYTANPTYFYPNVGTYTANLVATSNFGCVAAASGTVAVFANPTVTFTSMEVCHGSPTTFTNLSTIGSGQLISYAWDFGDASYAYSHSPQHTYASAGVYTTQLTVTSDHNCVSVFTHTALVNSLPITNFTTNDACQNQTTQFNNSTVIAGGTIAKWRWDFQNDGTWDDTISVNPSFVYPAFGNYNCRLQAISNKQCLVQKINNVVVHGNPVAGFYTKSSCLGDVTTFTNTSYSPDGAITSNQWDFNGDNIIDNVFASPTTTYTVNGTYLVKLEVQTQFGCTDVKSKSVYVNPRPSPLFSAKNNKGCPTLCTSFTNSSNIATGAIVTAQWNFGDGSLPAYGNNPTHCYNSGNYDITLKVVSDSGCIATLKMPNLVTVYPQPVAGFKVEPEEIDELEPNISVTSQAIDAGSISYFINDGSSYNMANFNHTLKNADKSKPIIFQVVTTAHGCADTTYKILDVKPTYVLYIPNTFTPNNDGLNDGFFAKGVGIATFNLKIYDRWGHLIFEANDINDKWDGTAKGSSETIKEDVYVWKAEVRDILDRNHKLTGHVTVLK
jgi:gliding motility-associated-like protein